VCKAEHMGRRKENVRSQTSNKRGRKMIRQSTEMRENSYWKQEVKRGKLNTGSNHSKNSTVGKGERRQLHRNTPSALQKMQSHSALHKAQPRSAV